MITTIENLHPSRKVSLIDIKRVLQDPNFATLKRQKRGCLIFLTTDSQIAKLHGRYLNEPTPTDVMSFDYGDSGEIIISLDRVYRQAKKRKIPLKWELMLLIIHGLLHLCGYNDQRLNQWKKMKVKEFETIIKLI